MTEVEKTLANFFVNIGRELKHRSSRIIAAELFVSPSTVSRFCQLLGYTGFSEFKEEYLKELDYLEATVYDVNPNLPFTQKDKSLRLAAKMLSLYKESVEDTFQLLHHDYLQKATRYLTKASIIYFAIVGDAYEMAETFKNRMLKIGKQVIVER